MPSSLPTSYEPALSRLSWGDVIASTSWHLKKGARQFAAWKAVWIGALVQLCIGGAPYGWTVAAPLLARRLAVITPTVNDWSVTEVTVVMSLSFLTMDIVQGYNAPWVNRIGARVSLALGGICTFCGYFLLASSALDGLQYKLVLGCIMIGLGMSFCYLPALQNAVAHHPESPGIVSGIVIGGFGAGAIFFAPMFEFLVRSFAFSPLVVSQEELDLKWPGIEFLQPDIEDLAILPYDLPDVPDGYGFVPGTGSNGLAPSLFIIGSIYAIVLVLCGYLTTNAKSSQIAIPLPKRILFQDGNFFRVTYFKLIAAVAITAIMGTAKTVMAKNFSVTFPKIVTSRFTSMYLIILTTGSISGRILWPVLTDVLGPRETFYVMLGSATLVYCIIPFSIQSIKTEKDVFGLITVVLGTVYAVSVASGIFAALVTYNGVLFGRKRVHEVYGAITLITFWGPVVGPTLMLTLRTYPSPSGGYGGYEFYTLAILHALGILANKTMRMKCIAGGTTEEEGLSLGPAGSYRPSNTQSNESVSLEEGNMEKAVQRVVPDEVGWSRNQSYRRGVELEGLELVDQGLTGTGVLSPGINSAETPSKA